MQHPVIIIYGPPSTTIRRVIDKLDTLSERDAHFVVYYVIPHADIISAINDQINTEVVGTRVWVWIDTPPNGDVPVSFSSIAKMDIPQDMYSKTWERLKTEFHDTDVFVYIPNEPHNTVFEYIRGLAYNIETYGCDKDHIHALTQAFE